jgi:L-methionine (R)-S-oxide reductase
MEEKRKEGRYGRIYRQLEELTAKTDVPLARMATICAVLHHKMEYFFWTGFYICRDEKLVVGPYQGPVACQELEPRTGVCWAVVERKEAVIVPDVHAYPGHIACDSRSASEIALPVRDQSDKTVAVFDVDSDEKDMFSDADRRYLSRILELIYR